MLAVRDVRIHDQAGDREMVHGVSFELTPGKVVGIVGESGSGKTLTCRAALGILPEHFEISAGSVTIDGTDIATLTPRQWTRLRGSTISAVFQDPASYLNPSLRVGAQIAEVLRVKTGLKRRDAHAARWNCSRRCGCAIRNSSTGSTRSSCPAACSSAS